LAREIRAVASAVRLREDYSAAALRALAGRAKDANQSRRLLSLAAVRDGMDRGSAAKIGGMDRQTLRDWVHRFDALPGPRASWTTGRRVPSLVFRRSNGLNSQIVEAGPDREKDGVVRWPRLDLKRVIAERFGVDFHPRYVGKLLKKLGFSTSVRGPVIQRRTRGPSRLSKRMGRPVCKRFPEISV
jgi:transposase